MLDLNENFIFTNSRLNPRHIFYCSEYFTSYIVMNNDESMQILCPRSPHRFFYFRAGWKGDEKDLEAESQRSSACDAPVDDKGV